MGLPKRSQMVVSLKLTHHIPSLNLTHHTPSLEHAQARPPLKPVAMDKSSYQLVRYKGYEIATNRGTIQKWRDGSLDWSNVLLSDEVYTNVAKALRATDVEMKGTFGTSDVSEIAKIIATEGELQLTTAELREKTEQRRREMLNYIHKYYVDPKSKKPHPITRLENAFEAMKIRVDPHTPAERQVQDKVIKRLPEFLPVKKCVIEGILTVPTSFLGQAMGVVTSFAQIQSESYTASECRMSIQVLPGSYDALMSKLSSATKGNATFEVAGGMAASTEDDGAAGGKGKGKRGKGKGKRGKRK